jgi:hypothetical protein
MILHANVMDKVAIFLQTLPGIKGTYRLEEHEKKHKQYVLLMSLKTIVGCTDVKQNATRRQRMKQQLN